MQQFQPRDRSLSRRELGLPADVTVIAFGAASLGNRRKGAQEFYQAISLLRDPSEIPSHDRIPEVRSTGFLKTPEELTRVYSAADLFVMPSLGENMPQTVVEAMACGIPAVAFSVGGIPEIVQPRKTGLLASLQNCEELSQQIQWMIEHPLERKAMGSRSRKLVCAEFDLDRQTDKYLCLYDEVRQIGCSATHSKLLRSA